MRVGGQRSTKSGAILRELISLASGPGGLNGRLKTQTSRSAVFCFFFPQQTAAFRLHACLALCQLASIVPHSNGSFFFASAFIQHTFQRAPNQPGNPAEEPLHRLKPPHSTGSNSGKLKEGESFLLSDETGSRCQSAPSVSRSQLAPDVHHTMERRFASPGKPGGGETAGRRAASAMKTEPRAVPAPPVEPDA